MKVIKCDVKVHNRDSEEFKLQMQEYEKDLERSEILGIPPTLEEPTPDDNFFWCKCSLRIKKLDEQFNHYLEDCDNEGELKICYEDGSAMIIKKTEKIIKILDNI